MHLCSSDFHSFFSQYLQEYVDLVTIYSKFVTFSTNLPIKKSISKNSLHILYQNHFIYIQKKRIDCKNHISNGLLAINMRICIPSNSLLLFFHCLYFSSWWRKLVNFCFFSDSNFNTAGIFIIHIPFSFHIESFFPRFCFKVLKMNRFGIRHHICQNSHLTFHMQYTEKEERLRVIEFHQNKNCLLLILYFEFVIEI